MDFDPAGRTRPTFQVAGFEVGIEMGAGRVTVSARFALEVKRGELDKKKALVTLRAVFAWLKEWADALEI